jgi:hypothetical protein
VVRYSFADGINDARDLGAGREWARWFGLIFSLDQQDVEEVERGGSVFDPYLAGFGFGNWYVCEFHLVWFTPVVDTPSFHEKSPFQL